MPQPTARLDDDALVARILEEVPEAGDARRVRSLLAAWWRYAGVRNAAGAVVDSETFVAERGALGLLELPPAVAKQVIELEFALLHEGRAATAAAPAAPPAAPPAPEPAAEPAPPLRVVHPTEPEAEPTKAEPTTAQPKKVARPVPPPAEEPRARRNRRRRPESTPAPPPETSVAPTAPAAPEAPAAPTRPARPERATRPEPEPIPIAALDEAVPEPRETAPPRERTREEAQTAIMAGIVVFFSIVVGLAMLLGQQVDHLSLPTGSDEPLVAGWRAFLAICSGFGGFAVGLIALARLDESRRAAVVAPAAGLLGLGVLGLGLLSGSVVITAAGAVLFAAGGAVALLRR